MLASLLLVLPLTAAEPAAPAAPAPPAPTLALPTLARTLEADLARVRALERVVAPSVMFAEVRRELPRESAKLASLEASLLAIHPKDLTFRELDIVRIGWLGVDQTLARWESALEHDARVVVDAGNELKTIDETWRVALEAEWRERIPDALLTKIAGLLSATQKARQAMAGRLGEVLVLQAEVAGDRSRVHEALDRTFALSTDISEQLFAVERNSLWSALREPGPQRHLGAQVAESWRTGVAGVSQALQGQGRRCVFHAALFAALVAAAIVLARRTRGDPQADPAARRAAEFLDRPWSSAGMLAVLAALFIYPATGIHIRYAALTVALLPYCRLVPKVVEPVQTRAAYGLAGLFFVDRLHDFAVPHSLLQRLLLLAVGVLGVAGWAWAYRSARRAAAAGAPSWGPFWRTGARIAMVCLAIAVVANVVGNVSLAEQLTVVAVNGLFSGGLLFLIARCLEAYLVLVLRWLVSLGSRVVVRNLAMLERRGRRAIWIAATFAWGFYLLWILRIVEQSGTALVDLFEKKWAVGKIHIGLGGVVAFASALTIGIVVARLLRFVLDEAVLPRMSLPRGVPAAISTTIGYLVVGTGFVMAFLAAGLEMSQFTFLAGAFGVGIGFGLQNVVNNFVSGLILLYERPIQVGDVLTVGEFHGRVRRIGVRSSTLETFDGAEVIVPNATLISTDVVNWTLSDRVRRVEIPIGVAYGTDPKVVSGLLLGVARAHPSVLATPPPVALFVRFGESSLDFELRIWTPDFDTYMIVASELRTAIVAALGESGISIPFPQRDVHLHGRGEEAEKG